jgi:hypothetical protein
VKHYVNYEVHHEAGAADVYISTFAPQEVGSDFSAAG